MGRRGVTTRPSANLDLVRSIITAWERGDYSAAEGVDIVNLVVAGYEWFNRQKEPPPTWLSDGEFINAGEDPDHATYRGIHAIRKQHQGWFDAYPDLQVEPLEIRAYFTAPRRSKLSASRAR